MQRGTRIELQYISDPHTELKPGALGTVTMTDALGTIHVAWDSGSTLGLIPGEDRWAEAKEPTEETQAERLICRDNIRDKIKADRENQTKGNK